MNTWISEQIRARAAHRVGAWVLVWTVLMVAAAWHHAFVSELLFDPPDASLRLLLIVPVGLLAVATFVDGRTAWRYRDDPGAHPVVQRALSRGDPAGTSLAAEREIRAPRFRGRNGWLVTDQFVIQSTFFTFDILRLADVLWVYRARAERRGLDAWAYAGTLALPSWEAVIVCPEGRGYIEGGKRLADAVVAFAAARVPWAFQGHSKELARALEDDPHAFAATVARRRRDWERERSGAIA